MSFTQIWVTSDTHFSHANILTFLVPTACPVAGFILGEGLLTAEGLCPGCQVKHERRLRDFPSVEEMDETLVARWNAVVKPQDHVYHLGDVALKKPFLAIVQRLHGHKRLVPGNHDIFAVQDYLKAGFQKVMGMRVLDNLLLTHIPVHPSSLGRFKANVHGHVHSNQSLPLPYLNVCVEVTNYTPVALDDLQARVR